MRYPRLRAFLALATAASLGLLLLAPAGVLAGRAVRVAEHAVRVNCDFLQGDAGTLFLGTSISDRFGVEAGLDFWATGQEPFVDDVTFTTNFDEAATGTFEGTAFEGGHVTFEIPVLDSTLTPAGSASIDTMLVVSGPLEPFDDRFRNGNHWERSKGLFMPYEIVDGTATLPDGSVIALENGPCFAEEIQVTTFTTSPTSFVSKFSGTGFACALLSGDEQIGDLIVDVNDDRTSAFVDPFIFDPPMAATTEIEMVDGRVASDLTFINPETGEEVGPGSIDMTIAASGEPFSYTLRGGTETRRFTGEIFDVEGTLTAPGYEPFDLGDCFLTDSTTKRIVHPAKAPKPTGRPPANDLPSSARVVAPGSNLSQNTKNAALDMEEPFECLTEFDDDGNEFPLDALKTVWYRLDGTGETVTVDTAGSGFDTVIAVYTKAADGSFEPVPDGCVDDVPLDPIGRTLQAAVAIDTEVGTTYYIQVGGFPDDLNWGSLHIRVN